MDEQKVALAEYLERLAVQVRIGSVHAVFAVAISDDGPRQVVLVDPEHREPLIIAINEEATRMLGTEHHLVSTQKLKRFLDQQQISDKDLLDFGQQERLV